MTYIQKGAGLRTQQRRPIHSRDLLWIDINSHAILNAYRQPLSLDVIDYITHLAPPLNCLVGGDFNAWHDMFEPGVLPTHQGPRACKLVSQQWHGLHRSTRGTHAETRACPRPHF